MKDYQKKIDEYDIDAAKNETFNILENTLVNSLIDVIIQAVSSTEVGKMLKGKIDEYKNIIEEVAKTIEENIDENNSKKDGS